VLDLSALPNAFCALTSAADTFCISIILFN